MTSKLPRLWRVGSEINGVSVLNPHVKITRSCRDPEDSTMWILESSYGTIRVPHNRLVSFPLRADLSTREWLDLEKPPTVGDLCVGDILPPAELKPPALQKLYVQEVTAVYRYIDRVHYNVETHTFGEQDGAGRSRKRVFQVTKYDKLIFPREEFNARVRASSIRDTNVKMAGPYIHEDNPNADIGIEYYYFLIHPSGRGRWPKGTPDFGDTSDRIGDNGCVMRAPREAYKWRPFRFVGDTTKGQIRHPSDRTHEVNAQLYRAWKERQSPADRPGTRRGGKGLFLADGTPNVFK